MLTRPYTYTNGDSLPDTNHCVILSACPGLSSPHLHCYKYCLCFPSDFEALALVILLLLKQQDSKIFWLKDLSIWLCHRFWITSFVINIFKAILQK